MPAGADPTVNSEEPSSKRPGSKPGSTASRSGSTKRKKARNTPSLVPLDIARTSPVAGFVDVIEPKKTREDVVLSPENAQILTDLKVEYSRAGTLKRHGLDVRSKLMFCGPPGCGKTLTAEVFAHETGLELFVVRLDALISSFLGETASNLRTVMEAAERRPCILFFDEFDALARARSESEGHGELRRVVNSLLVMIEQFRGQGFLIAATNLDYTLDGALWRRFDEVVLFERPNAEQIESTLLLNTRNFPADYELGSHALAMKGFSYAQIHNVCIQAIKNALLSRRKKINRADFKQALASEERRRSIQQRLVRQDP